MRWCTGKSQEELDVFFSTVNEMNDISCFTYEPSNFMWKEYANNGNGFCMEFELNDSDKFFMFKRGKGFVSCFRMYRFGIMEAKFEK